MLQATGGDEAGRGRPALPAQLTREIREFLDENPDMAESNLSGFATTACKWYLARLRRDKFIKLITQEAKDGRLPKNLAEALRLPDD